jgi:hypothetical protein
MNPLQHHFGQFTRLLLRLFMVFFSSCQILAHFLIFRMTAAMQCMSSSAKNLRRKDRERSLSVSMRIAGAVSGMIGDFMKIKYRDLSEALHA